MAKLFLWLEHVRTMVVSKCPAVITKINEAMGELRLYVGPPVALVNTQVELDNLKTLAQEVRAL